MDRRKSRLDNKLTRDFEIIICFGQWYNCELSLGPDQTPVTTNQLIAAEPNDAET
jgi:hypothetical protein